MSSLYLNQIAAPEQLDLPSLHIIYLQKSTKTAKPMNYRSLLGLALLVCVTGCSSAVSDRPQSTDQSQSLPSALSQQPTQASPQPLIKPATPTASIPPKAQTTVPRVSVVQPPKYRINPPTSSPVPVKPSAPEANAPNTGTGKDMERDYGFTTPIASTGKLTVRDRIRLVDADKLFTSCPTDTAPYALAESTHYRIQICSGEYDPQLPKYYIGQDKNGGDELRITSSNLDEARQLVFKNGDYTYVLYGDSAKPDTTNAYLEVYMPNGKSYAEALLYLYE
jgi:hypothetical protein